MEFLRPTTSQRCKSALNEYFGRAKTWQQLDEYPPTEKNCLTSQKRVCLRGYWTKWRAQECYKVSTWPISVLSTARTIVVKKKLKTRWDFVHLFSVKEIQMPVTECCYKDCMEYQPVEFHISQKRGLQVSYHTKSGKSDKVPGEKWRDFIALNLPKNKSGWYLFPENNWAISNWNVIFS